MQKSVNKLKIRKGVKKSQVFLRNKSQLGGGEIRILPTSNLKQLSHLPILLSDFFLAAKVVNVLCQWQTNTNLDSYGRKKQSRHILTQHLSCFGLFFLSLQNQEAFDCYRGNKDLLRGFFGGSWILSPNEKEVEILCLGNRILRVRGGKATDSMEACIQQVNCGVERLHPLRHLNILSFLPNFALFTLYLVFLSFHQGRCQIWVFYVQGYPPFTDKILAPKKCCISVVPPSSLYGLSSSSRSFYPKNAPIFSHILGGTFPNFEMISHEKCFCSSTWSFLVRSIPGHCIVKAQGRRLIFATQTAPYLLKLDNKVPNSRILKAFHD